MLHKSKEEYAQPEYTWASGIFALNLKLLRDLEVSFIPMRMGDETAFSYTISKHHHVKMTTKWYYNTSKGTDQGINLNPKLKDHNDEELHIVKEFLESGCVKRKGKRLFIKWIINGVDHELSEEEHWSYLSAFLEKCLKKHKAWVEIIEVIKKILRRPSVKETHYKKKKKHSKEGEEHKDKEPVIHVEGEEGKEKEEGLEEITKKKRVKKTKVNKRRKSKRIIQIKRRRRKQLRS